VSTSPSIERVASRFLEAKYDPFEPKSADEVLYTHLYTIRPDAMDELNQDVTGEASARTALLKRARAWSLDKFTEHMEQYAWNNRIDELRNGLAEEPLQYRVVVNRKTKAKGNTAKGDVAQLQENLKELYKYEKWADQWELVVQPRPKSDYRKLDALVAMRKERERAWASLYKQLREQKPGIQEDRSGGNWASLLVVDQGVKVGGIQAENIERTDFEKVPALKSKPVLSGGCWEDILKLAERFGDGEVWAIHKSTLWPEYRGKGLGFNLYEKLIHTLKRRPGPVYLEAGECLRSGGSTFGLTSADAHRVWKKLVVKYPSSGTVIAIV